MAEADLFRMYVPKTLGGLEVDAGDLARRWSRRSRGSTARHQLVSVDRAVHGALGAYLREDVARAIYCDDPRTVVAGSVNASGVARATDGGCRISGCWTFASGIHHSAWVCGNCVVRDERHAPRAGRRPRDAAAFFPVDQCEIHDTWHVSGLRGTGSHDFSVADLFVPEERSLVAFTAKPYQPGRCTCPFVTFAASIAGRRSARTRRHRSSVVINMKAAKAIGLTIPPSLLQRGRASLQWLPAAALTGRRSLGPSFSAVGPRSHGAAPSGI